MRSLAALLFVLTLAACGGARTSSGTDVAVFGSGPTDTVTTGSVVTFTMTVQNVGSNEATTLTLTDQVSAALKQPSITCAASSGATCPQTMGFVMSLPSLPVGGQLVFTITATVDATANGTVSNSMAVRVSGDTNENDNTAIVTANVTGTSSNLAVAGTGPTGTVSGGGQAVFVMTVTNGGPDAAASVKIINSVGGNLTLSGITCAATGGATCPSPGVVMTLDSLPAGGSLQFQVTTNVQAGVSGTIVNTMTATAANDAVQSGSSKSATAIGTSYTAKAGIFATGTGPATAVTGGAPAVFSMVITNAGPDAATDVKITNTVGSNLTLNGVTCTANGGATCPATGVVMSVPTLPAGGVLVFTVTATVAPATNGAILNTMTVTAADDPDRTDNTAVAVGTASTSRANLTIVGTPPTGQVAGGDIATFIMTVGNSGPNDAQDVRIVDTVGGNLTLVSGMTCSASNGASCPSTGTVMNVPLLPVGGTLVFSVPAKVAIGTSGSIINTMSASASNGPASGGPTAVVVGQAAVSALSVTGLAPSNVPAGTGTTFTMTVANAGPLDATNVQLTDTVGGNLTFTGITCSATGNAVCPTPGVVMTVPTLPVGGSLVFQVGVAVAAGTNGAIINSMVASTSSGAQAQVNGVAVGSAYATNLSVAATGPTDPLPGGAGAIFSMVVTNAGPGTATNVSITDTVSGLIALNGGGAAITCTPLLGAVCPTTMAAQMTAPSIPPNGALSFSVPVTVQANGNGTASNTMTVTAPGDSRSSNNSATASVSLFSADLGVSQTGPTSVVFGGTAEYTALVSNPGPGSSSNVTITSTVTGGVGTVVSCSPSLSCPAVLGPVMTLPNLGAGRVLTFTIQVPVQSSSGNIVSTMSVTADGDPSTSNNSATVTTRRVDPRSGSYRVYAADGYEYAMAIDFDAGTYSLSGNNQALGRSFTVDPADANGYVTVGSNEHFRLAADLIVGQQTLAGVAQPYVAARVFSTSVASIGGSYNLATRNLVGGASPSSHAGTARIVDNVLYLCQSDISVYSVSGCPSGSLSTYLMSVQDGLFHGINTDAASPLRTIDFRVAQSGALSILISAGLSEAGTSQQLRIGLQDAPVIVGGSLKGPAETKAGASDWTSVALNGSSLSVVGGTINNTVPTLTRLSGSGTPTSMLFGHRSGDSATLWVMQSHPLAVVWGDCGFDGTTCAGPASGDLQLAIP